MTIEVFNGEEYVPAKEAEQELGLSHGYFSRNSEKCLYAPGKRGRRCLVPIGRVEQVRKRLATKTIPTPVPASKPMESEDARHTLTADVRAIRSMLMKQFAKLDELCTEIKKLQVQCAVQAWAAQPSNGSGHQSEL